MRLTTKGRYAVTALLDLAINATEQPVPLSDISNRQHISLSYLEQLFTKLRRKDLVKSIRGSHGGYQLSKSMNSITITDVIEAVNESLDATKCRGKRSCQDGNKCLTHHLWLDLSDQIHNFLSNITLADLVNKRNPKQYQRNITTAHKIKTSTRTQ